MENNQKIIIVDSFSINNFHETFNSAFLLALTSSSKKKITYYASKSAVLAIKNLVKKNKLTSKLDNVDFSVLKIHNGTSSVGIFLRYILGFFINTNRLFFSSKEDVIIFTILNPFFVWPLQFFLFLFKRNVYVICHGELELPIKKSVFYKPSFVYKKLIHSFLNYGKLNKQLKLLLLGENIKQYLLSLYPNITNQQLLTIDHPVIFKKDENSQEIKVQSDKLTIGTVGAVSMEKGFDKLVYLSNELNLEHVNINVVGSYHFNVSECHNLNFISKDGLQLPTDVYTHEINNLDFVLFMFNKESYKLTVSGAVFDAINLNKPIIAIKNNYFEAVFKLYGPIGYLCDNVDEMCELIDKLKDNSSHKEQYSVFRNNISELKTHYSFKNIGEQLNKISL